MTIKDDNVIGGEEMFNPIVDYSEEVPYMNNDGDIVQDSIKEIKKLTERLQDDFLSKDNVVNVDFSRSVSR